MSGLEVRLLDSDFCPLWPKQDLHNIKYLMPGNRQPTSTHPGLELLHLLLSSLHGDLFSFIQTVLQIFDGLLHVLLHTLQIIIGPDRVIQLNLTILIGMKSTSLIPAATLSFKRALQGVNGPLQVPLALFNLVEL
uniref:Uncharacterized protein n=1 Tax=Amphiprion percula TaxID=161767 RepID=A0A3P8SHX7_AMPPE